jgi:tetratricopeptide (TPR) repeat protein
MVALPYYGAMLELTERVFGLFHFQCGNILEAMCTCYEKTNKMDKAVACLQRVIVLKGVTGDESDEKSKECFFIMGRLAEMYMMMNYIDLAKELLTKMEESAKEAFGVDSFERGRALCSLAGVLERNDEAEDAEKKLLQCIELEGYLHPKDNSKLVATSIAFYNLGMILRNHNKMKDAKSRFEQSMKLKKEGGLPASDPEVVECQEMIDSCAADK